MKLSTIFLACSASAAEADDTPTAKLNHLKNITAQIFTSDSIIERRGKRRGGPNVKRWGRRWTERFMKNSGRMKQNFERCGTTPTEADDEPDIEYDFENPCGAIKQLTTEFTRWVNRHMSSCNGQKNHSHHEDRMERWQNLLHKGNRFDLSFSE